MTFVKGVSGNPSGKPVGSKGIAGLQWESIGNYLVTEGAEGVVEVLQDLRESDPKAFLAHVESVLEYFKPKLSRSEVKTDLNLHQRPLRELTDEELLKITE